MIDRICSNLSHINIHRQFFIKISQNVGYIQTHCNDRRNPFHFACQKWIKNCM